MSHSMYGADRATHLKVIVISLACATMVAAVGIFAHGGNVVGLGTAPLFQAGEPTIVSGKLPNIR
ncbi:MAG: hypothetical protein ACRECE_05010 [Xanthobacteraceae bacterium]